MVLDCVVSKGLSQEVTFEQRSEGGSHRALGDASLREERASARPLMRAPV